MQVISQGNTHQLVLLLSAFYVILTFHTSNYILLDSVDCFMFTCNTTLIVNKFINNEQFEYPIFLSINNT